VPGEVLLSVHRCSASVQVTRHASPLHSVFKSCLLASRIFVFTLGSSTQRVFGRLQADTVAAVWTAAAAIHREKNTVEAAAAVGLQPQQAAANSPSVFKSCLLASRIFVFTLTIN
jgi:hypothetical protein